MTQHKQSRKRLTTVRKIPPERHEEYVEYKTRQQSNDTQHLHLAVPSEVAETAVHIYLGYRRCTEFDEGNKPGQDYAVLRVGDGYVVGVVADGVSRSFYGNLAAESLSTWAVDKLWQRRTATPDLDSMDQLLKNEEAKFARTLEDYRIPADLPMALVKALERKRPKGSQTVFAAFVLKVASSNLTLYQVGDVRALIHNSKPEPELVEAKGEGRWSSGRQSHLLLKRTLFENVDGLVIKSDGVSDDWGHILEESALNADQFSLMSEKHSQLDDISFIAVRCHQVSTESITLAPPRELLSESSSEAKSEVTPVDQNGSTSDGHDVAEVPDKKEDADKAAEHIEVARKRLQWRSVKIFMAGVTSGAALGATLMFLAFFTTGRLKTASWDGKQVGRQSNPASEKQSSAAPDGGNIAVAVKETEQRKFLKEHRSSLPPFISGNPTTARGEVIAHVSTRNINVERVEFALSDKDQGETARARDSDQTSFFVRLPGLADSKTVTIRLVDPKGNVIGEFHEKMRGREKSSAANNDPFLGYHEILVTRAQ